MKKEDMINNNKKIEKKYTYSAISEYQQMTGWAEGYSTKENLEKELEAIKKEVEKRCTGNGKVEIQEIEKNNGVIKYGMIIHNEKKSVSPLIYLEPYLMELRKGKPIEETAESIYYIYQKWNKSDSIIASNDLNVGLAKDNMIYQLISLEKNEERLRNMPHRIIGEDLAVVFSVLLEKNNQAMMSAKISHDCLKHWGMKEEELWELADKNTPKLLPVKMERLTDVLIDLLKAQIEESGIELNEEAWNNLLDTHKKQMDEQVELPMYILSNQYKVWGASTILYPGALKAAAKQLDGDLIVLPSSIHEVILVRKEMMLDYDTMAEMVKEINQKEVLEEEVLSDSVYLYCRKDDSFRRVSWNKAGYLKE